MEYVEIRTTTGRKVQVTEEEILSAVLKIQRSFRPVSEVFIIEDKKKVAVILPVVPDDEDDDNMY